VLTHLLPKDDRAMLVVMSHNATPEQIERVVDTIRRWGTRPRRSPGSSAPPSGLIGNDGKVDASRLEALPGVLQVIHVTQPYKQVSREWREEPTVIELPNGTRIGGTRWW
jgi:3-deoxy-7-phosphoheptulonate synthase